MNTSALFEPVTDTAQDNKLVFNTGITTVTVIGVLQLLLNAPTFNEYFPGTVLVGMVNVRVLPSGLARLEIL